MSDYLEQQIVQHLARIEEKFEELLEILNDIFYEDEEVDNDCSECKNFCPRCSLKDTE